MKDVRFRIGILVGVAIAAMVATRVEAAQKMQYKLTLQKGQKYYIRMITEQQITQTVMGQEQNIEQTIGMGTDFDVNDVDEKGNAWVRYAYRWAKFRQKGPMGEIVYDSSKKDSQVSPATQGFAALLGEEFWLKITSKGQVVEVKGLDKMRSNIQKKLPEGPMREAMMQGLQQYLGEEGIKELIESSMAMYPDMAVGVGDSWSKTIVLSYGLPMILENKWTLKQRKDGVATIEVASTFKPNPQAKPMEMGPTKMSYEISGKQQGIIEMEESTGRLISSKLNQEMSGQIKMVVSGPQPQEMAMPVKIKGVVTMEMSEREKTGAK